MRTLFGDQRGVYNLESENVTIRVLAERIATLGPPMSRSSSRKCSSIPPELSRRERQGTRGIRLRPATDGEDGIRQIAGVAPRSCPRDERAALEPRFPQTTARGRAFAARSRDHRLAPLPNRQSRELLRAVVVQGNAWSLSLAVDDRGEVGFVNDFTLRRREWRSTRVEPRAGFRPGGHRHETKYGSPSPAPPSSAASRSTHWNDPRGIRGEALRAQRPACFCAPRTRGSRQRLHDPDNRRQAHLLLDEHARGIARRRHSVSGSLLGSRQVEER